jgi:AraC-like DNA-binding protein
MTLQLLPRARCTAHDPAHTGSIGVALERQTGVHSIGSDRREPFDRWPGTLAVTPPGIDIFSESPTGGEYVVLRCATAIEATGGDGGGHHERTRICVSGARAAFTLAREIRRALLAPTLDETSIEDMAWRLAALGAASAHDAPLHAGRRTHVARDDARLYAGALERIADAFAQPLALEELAAMTSQSPLAFLRGFTAAVGLTPHAFLTERRLQAARHLLADPDRPLTDIALACGFSHQSHFGNAFKRAFGLTPAQYRRLRQGLA